MLVGGDEQTLHLLHLLESGWGQHIWRVDIVIIDDLVVRTRVLAS